MGFCRIWAFKEALSRGYAEDLVSVFIHTQNAPVELWRRYQKNFIKNHLPQQASIHVYF